NQYCNTLMEHISSQTSVETFDNKYRSDNNGKESESESEYEIEHINDDNDNQDTDVSGSGGDGENEKIKEDITYSLIGLETDSPRMRIGNMYFKGEYDESIGTDL
ncbi:9691_t:CDS:2, partial [Dentiscutata heterogama]